MWEVIAPIAAAGLNFAGNYFLSENSNSNARDNAQDAFDASQRAYATRYQTTVADMRAAGLNPILAASGGFSVGNAPQMQSAAAPSAQMSQPINFGGSAKDYGEIDKIRTEIEWLNETIGKTASEAEKIRVETEESRKRIDMMDTTKGLQAQQTMESAARTAREQAQSGKISKETATEVERLNNLVADTKGKIEMYKRTGAEIDRLHEEIKNLATERNRITADTIRSGADTARLREEAQNLQRLRAEIQSRTRNLEAARSGIEANSRSAEAISEKLTSVNQYYKGIGGIGLSAIRAAADAIGLHSGLKLPIKGE